MSLTGLLLFNQINPIDRCNYGLFAAKCSTVSFTCRERERSERGRQDAVIRVAGRREEEPGCEDHWEDGETHDGLCLREEREREDQDHKSRRPNDRQEQRRAPANTGIIIQRQNRESSPSLLLSDTGFCLCFPLSSIHSFLVWSPSPEAKGFDL